MLACVVLVYSTLLQPWARGPNCLALTKLNNKNVTYFCSISAKTSAPELRLGVLEDCTYVHIRLSVTVYRLKTRTVKCLISPILPWFVNASYTTSSDSHLSAASGHSLFEEAICISHCFRVQHPLPSLGMESGNSRKDAVLNQWAHWWPSEHCPLKFNVLSQMFSLMQRYKIFFDKWTIPTKKWCDANVRLFGNYLDSTENQKKERIECSGR